MRRSGAHPSGNPENLLVTLSWTWRSGPVEVLPPRECDTLDESNGRSADRPAWGCGVKVPQNRGEYDRGLAAACIGLYTHASHARADAAGLLIGSAPDWLPPEILAPRPPNEPVARD